MSLAGVNNNSSISYYHYETSDTKAEAAFSLEIQEESEETSQKEQGKVPSSFLEMSFADIFYNSEIKRNQIPVVNQIVSSKNPETGEIYRTYFTDNKILCYDAGGKTEWEIGVNEDQQQKVKDYFKELTSCKWAKELYSGSNMAMASVKDFWLKLFEKNARFSR